MKTQITTKRFYDKWLYKVTFKTPFSFVLGDFKKKKNRLKAVCTSDTNRNEYYWYYSSTQHEIIQSHRSEILKFIGIMEQYSKDEWTTRNEWISTRITVFTNNAELYDRLCNDEYTVFLKSAPDLTNSLLDTPNTIVVKSLPYNRYQYKVYLSPHKIKSVDQKLEYIEWIKSQVPRITFSEAIEWWVNWVRWSGDRRYILVEDEHTLLMLRMRNPEAVGKIYKMVVA